MADTGALPMLMTEAEAAVYVHHSRATLARERRLGRLPYVKGRPPLIFRDDLLAWLERRRVDVVASVTGHRAFDPIRVADRAILKQRMKSKR
jgi:hypothetical protein